MNFVFNSVSCWFKNKYCAPCAQIVDLSNGCLLEIIMNRSTLLALQVRLSWTSLIFHLNWVTRGISSLILWIPEAIKMHLSCITTQDWHWVKLHEFTHIFKQADRGPVVISLITHNSFLLPHWKHKHWSQTSWWKYATTAALHV